MAREQTLRCDMCSKQINEVAGKIYITPSVPGRAVSFMSAYSHSGDLCSECIQGLSDKLTRRKPRNGNGSSTRAKKRGRRSVAK